VSAQAPGSMARRRRLALLPAEQQLRACVGRSWQRPAGGNRQCANGALAAQGKARQSSTIAWYGRLQRCLGLAPEQPGSPWKFRATAWRHARSRKNRLIRHAGQAGPSNVATGFPGLRQKLCSSAFSTSTQSAVDPSPGPSLARRGEVTGPGGMVLKPWRRAAAR